MQEVIHGTAIILIYFLIAASVAIGCRFLIKIPNELFRKILHGILLGSLFMFVLVFETWWIVALEAVIFAILVYPVLVFFERFHTYSQVTTERKKGELKTSLLLVFFMYATVVTVCWGWFGDKYLVLASVSAWGFGDAAAAMLGKRFGKHKITWKYTDGKKSLEGSLSMFLVSFISVAAVLLCRGGLSAAGCIVISLVTALVSTIAELYSKGGNDTVICPLSAMAVLLPLVYMFGGMV